MRLVRLCPSRYPCANEIDFHLRERQPTQLTCPQERYHILC